MDEIVGKTRQRGVDTSLESGTHSNRFGSLGDSQGESGT